MFDKIFRRKPNYTIYGFYKWDKQFVDEQSVLFVIDYFKKNFNLEFKFILFDDIKFNKDYKFEIKSGLNKLNNLKWKDIVTVDLYERNILQSLSDFSFTMARVNNPSIFIIKIPNSITFNIDSFLVDYNQYFVPDYGFKYFVSNSEWDTQYVYRNYYDCLPFIKGVKRLSKNDKERFIENNKKLIEGHFRDIYYWNCLNENHLTNKIGTKSVREIINDKNLGKLHNIYEGVYSWELDDKTLDKARDIFYKSNLMI